MGPATSTSNSPKASLDGCVGIDGFLGPREILALADETGRPDFIAADLLAQAEHDPGSCFLLTTCRSSPTPSPRKSRNNFPLFRAARRSKKPSPITVPSSSIPRSTNSLLLANFFAAEHVNIQTKDDQAILKKLTHAGAVCLGPWSPIAAGDYIAGPSHCLPTNTTARFSSGISVYEFLKRSSIARYQAAGLQADSAAIQTLAEAEHLDAHAASIKIRESKKVSPSLGKSGGG